MIKLKKISFIIYIFFCFFVENIKANENIYEKIDLFSEVLDKINNEYVEEINQNKVNSSKLIETNHYLKNKSLNQIILSQKKATEKVFIKKNIPFRSFEIIKRNEKTLGELFCFFILETILIGRALKINPYDQPSVELIKKETKKILI